MYQIKKMTYQKIQEYLKEFSKTRPNAGKDKAALLEVALFIEDVFSLVLDDKDICEENLGTYEAAEIFLRKILREP